ncbi:Tn3 family transposase [Cupriavidus sp. LEh21]|nr:MULTISPECIES: transposase [unclassified Cupriavidus]MDK2661461.1 Tn3 family transposase [Cupriavidus sp. LEh21]
MRVFEMSRRLSRAKARVVEFQRTHPITVLWGTDQRVSSDSMSLDTSPHLFYARVDRRSTHLPVADLNSEVNGLRFLRRAGSYTDDVRCEMRRVRASVAARGTQW